MRFCENCWNREPDGDSDAFDLGTYLGALTDETRKSKADAVQDNQGCVGYPSALKYMSSHPITAEPISTIPRDTLL